jgi:peptide/nickel transport system ATP-binding protein
LNLEQVLKIEDLRTHFFTSEGIARAVDGVSVSVTKNSTLGIVGESGCGKSVTALSILRLIPSPPGRIVGGKITLAGVDILSLPEVELRNIRGKLASMIFQEPMTSLNPVFTIGTQIMEAVRIHTNMGKAEAREIAIEYLSLVGMPEPTQRMTQYPHQLSGGMKQRVMIAMALCLKPALLIADEPTTALDVTIQAQILDLMRDLKTRMGSAIMLITHDLGVVAEMAQRVVVMYAGRKVEEATVNEIFAHPMHPYTRGLLGAVPKLGSSLDEGGRSKLAEIAGLVPSLRKPIVGCAFAGRCSMGTDFCRTVAPAIERKVPGHLVACHYAGQMVAA